MPSGSVLIEEALEEFIEITQYLDGQSRGLGERFNLAFAEVVEMLLMFPEVGRELGEHSVRRMNLRNFSYHLIYRVEGDYLVIYAIAHHKQRPGYWTDRLK